MSAVGYVLGVPVEGGATLVYVKELHTEFVIVTLAYSGAFRFDSEAAVCAAREAVCGLPCFLVRGGQLWAIN